MEPVKLLPCPRPVYNLTVEGAHTYFVGGGQWLMHNSCRRSRTAPSRAAGMLIAPGISLYGEILCNYKSLTKTFPRSSRTSE